MKRLMVSPLSSKIYLTNVKETKEGYFQAIGQKQDYTDECIKAVFESMMNLAQDAGYYEIRFKGIKAVLSMQLEAQKSLESEAQNE
jgi:hypothetical protein